MFTRGDRIWSGASRFTETLGADPESGRPRERAAIALGTSQLAWSGTPGLLVNANDSCTSARGRMYEPAAVARVVMPGATWQYGFAGLYGIPPCEDAPIDVCSGRSSRMSQVSVTCCPVLVPPCTCRPSRSRALMLKSTPL